LSTKESLRFVDIAKKPQRQGLKNFARNVEISFIARPGGAFRKSSGEHFHAWYRGHECE
jgi:hypothetical protein